MGLYDHSDDKVYVVTLKDKNDLEGFYSDMEEDGYQIHLKRPISRSTQYYMNSTQAESLRSDSRIAAVEINPDDDPINEIIPFYTTVNNTPYGFNGDFEKSNTPGDHGDNDRQWGHLHSSGDAAARQKGAWGDDAQKQINDNVEVFADGRHVDVVIVDQPVSFDCAEWDSPSLGGTRFQQYQWFTELNQYVSSIDDDGNTLPTGWYTYHPNGANQTFHGTHVASTIAGKWYGWAPEANIYSLHVNLGSGFGSPITSTLVFDYLRAFHRHKPINPLTGKKNPTVTNHSWGSSANIYPFYERDLNVGDIQSVTIRGVQYNATNPGPSGWTDAGIHKDFGIGPTQFKYNNNSVGSRYDMEDAIEEGIICIGAAGNNDQYGIHADSTDPAYADWNNRIDFILPNTGYIYSHYHHRGSSPCNSDGCITVGSISNESDFKKSDFSNFGPLVDVWAPGDMIQGAWPVPGNIYNASGLNGVGYTDGKYGGDNFRYPISGTSMASPQVCGIAALIATGKERLTNSDILGFIQNHSMVDDMTYNINGGLFDDRTAEGSVNALHGIGSSRREIRAVNPRPQTGIIDGWYKETLKGHRRASTSFQNAQMYPRTNNFYRPIAQELYKTFPISLTANASNKWNVNGDDRNTSHVDAENPTINVKVGDTIQFNVNASGHPLWISIMQSTGQPASSLIPSGVTNNGDDVGTVTWNTSGNLTGTYYYNCEHHSAMWGMIFVNA